MITTVLDFGTSSTIDLNLLETALKKDKTYKAILVTHVDTSTSVKNEIAPIRALLNEINQRIDLVINLTANENELVSRLIKRSKNSGRSDDIAEVIIKRQKTRIWCRRHITQSVIDRS